MQFNQLRRREFITLVVGASAWPLTAHTQQAKLPIIGFLGISTRSGQSQWTAAFVQRLRELGWIEGRTVAIEYRWAEGRSERYPEIAAEFVRLKVDVIVAMGGAVPAVKQATSVIPVVFAAAADPPWRRISGQSRAAGRQHHGAVEPGDRSCQQATRTPARDSPNSSACGDLGQCWLLCRCAANKGVRGNGPQD
jgi:hypothetical protein